MVTQKTTGFTLVELMIVVVIIAVLAGIAVPSFLIYREKSLVTQVVGSGEAIRAALASYAAGSSDNEYPITPFITDFPSLRSLVNENGGRLAANAPFMVQHYHFYDSDGDNISDAYSMRLLVNGVAPAISGSQILITPQGIFKCVSSGNPC